MKKTLLIAALIITSLAIAPQANARDDALFMPINEALASDGSDEALMPNIKLHFAGQKGIGYSKTIGTYTTNRKTNAVLKKDKTACEWVMLSALKSLQERAVKEGGNAVINIHSYYDKKPYKSASKYECHAGATIAGVALRGTVVKR